MWKNIGKIEYHISEWKYKPSPKSTDPLGVLITVVIKVILAWMINLTSMVNSNN